MKISLNTLNRQYLSHADEYNKKFTEVMTNGYYILGPEVENFEKEFASYCGSKYCVGLASGLDALWLTFRILGIGQGDEVIIQSNTYIATALAVTYVGATPKVTIVPIGTLPRSEKKTKRVTDLRRD